MADFPKAVVFDWDNTLVNTWPVITEALNEARSAFGLEIWTEAEARVKSARALSETFPEWFGAEWEKARDVFYERFAAVHCQRLSVMADAEDLLFFLHEQKIPLFVVSNKKGPYLRAEADYLNWSRFFVAMVGAGDAPSNKPSREPVDIALKVAGMTADDSEIWFVGDTYADVECALRAGCTPVLLHDLAAAEQFGIKMSFSDCHTMKTALYNQCRTVT